MLKLSQPNISDSAIAAMVDIVKSGQLVHGSEGEAFEQELATYLGCDNVLLVSSGTAALHLALMGLEIGLGDAVIVPDFTFPATANAVALVGAKAVIVDVEPETYTISIEQLRELITNWRGPEKLKAIMPVHEFGCPAEMSEIMELAQKHNLYVIEDAACALGARYRDKMLGTIGDIGCYSFHPRKTLTTGEGGALVPRSAEVAKRLRRLRNHGMEKLDNKIHFLEASTNYRLTNFQATLGRHQLPHLTEWILKREKLVMTYRQQLLPLHESGQIRLPALVSGHSWQTFMILLSKKYDRDTIILELKQQGIESNLGAQSLTNINIYGPQSQSAPVGTELYKNGLALPLYENLTSENIEYIADTVRKILTN